MKTGHYFHENIFVQNHDNCENRSKIRAKLEQFEPQIIKKIKRLNKYSSPALEFLGRLVYSEHVRV